MKNGKHLIIDAYGCNRNDLWNDIAINDMLIDVTKIIGLKPLSDPLIYIVDETMIEKSSTGITGGIIFMESHFTFHAFPERNYFSADIYSCNTFDHKEVIAYINNLFNAKEIKETVIIRGTSL
jgi:S-adenosylmethionine decarboxylase proenzyme